MSSALEPIAQRVHPLGDPMWSSEPVMLNWLGGRLMHYKTPLPSLLILPSHLFNIVSHVPVVQRMNSQPLRNKGGTW